MWRVRFFQNGAGLRFDWVASSSREVTEQLSCSAPAGMTLQFLACLACVQLLTACSHKSPTRSSRESLFFLHTLEHFFTLSHLLPLQESHLNTGLLIAEIQTNLTWNKANKMVDKIQPYIYIYNKNKNSKKFKISKSFPKEEKIFQMKKNLWTRGIEPLRH